MSIISYMNEKIYSDVIELMPWDFCEDSLLPGPLLLYASNMQMKAFSYFYWNMFNRIQDKNVTFEVPLINAKIFGEPLDFLKERRVLFQTKINTVYESAMLQVNTKVFKSIEPFTQIAECVWNGVECVHRNKDHWVLGSFDEPLRINDELSLLVPPTDNIQVENTTFILNQLNTDKKEKWIGPVITRHRILHQYCEYGFMGAFMNYTGIILSNGKDALLKWIEAQGCNVPDVLNSLKKKTDYCNWKLWYSIKKAFFFDDTIEVASSIISFAGNSYIKHEIYSIAPKILRSIAIEEYKLKEI